VKPKIYLKQFTIILNAATIVVTTINDHLVPQIKPSAYSSFLCLIYEEIKIGAYNGINNKQFLISEKSGL